MQEVNRKYFIFQITGVRITRVPLYLFKRIKSSHRGIAEY